MKGNSGKAIQEAQMAVAYNGMNIDAKNLLATLLRYSGKKNEAKSIAAEVVKLDPLDYYATRELVMMGAKPEAELKSLLRGTSESYVELALYYMNNGFMGDTQEILEDAEAVRAYPTVEYYLGYIADLKGDKTTAEKWFKKAESGSIDYVFPFRLETVKVFGKALEYLPESANTWYYLGNLYYQKQPDKAMEAWENAVRINPDFAMALRNIGWGCRFWKNDLAESAEWYRKAIAADKGRNALFLAECDEILELMNVPVKERYDLFNGKEALYEKRYDSETKAIKLRILNGEYEEVLEPLLTRFYSRREHIEDLHDIYVDACLLSALKEWKNGNNEKALEYALMMNDYPANHGYAHLEYYARDAQVYYNIGLGYEKVGDNAKAREYFGKAAGVEVKPADGIYNYEKALAMKKLDPKANVRNMLRETAKYGKSCVTDYVERFFESFGYGDYPEDINTKAYYMQGIAYKGLGRNMKAKRFFRKALAERNGNIWANYYLGNIK